MNDSDAKNPRRLIRAIEICSFKHTVNYQPTNYELLLIGLTSSKENLTTRIKKRVADRGLAKSFEAKEVAIMRKQVVWFKKQPLVTWFDVTKPDWQAQAIKLVSSWYN